MIDYHIPTIEDVEPGAISLNGTIKVTNRTFNNAAASPTLTTTSMQLTSFEIGNINLISLTALNKVQIYNIKTIPNILKHPEI